MYNSSITSHQSSFEEIQCVNEMNNNNKTYSKFLAFVYLFLLHFKFTILLCLYCTPGIKREAFHRSKPQPMKWKKMGIAQTTDTLLHHKMHLITGRFLNYKCKYEIKLYLWLCACFIWSALMIWRVVFMVFDVLISLQEWMWLTQRRDARDTKERERNEYHCNDSKTNNFNYLLWRQYMGC